MFSISDSFNHAIFENPYFMEKLVGFYTELLSLNYAIESIKKNWNLNRTKLTLINTLNDVILK